MTTLRIVRDEPQGLAEIVATRIRVFLAEHRIKQTELADAIGISKGTVSKWISGKQTMDLNHVEQIANALGVRPGTFLTGETPTFPTGGGDVPPKRGGDQPTTIRIAA